MFCVGLVSLFVSSDQAVVMVLESNGETAVNMMVKLLKAFWETGLITIDQMNRVSAKLVLQCKFQMLMAMYTKH